MSERPRLPGVLSRPEQGWSSLLLLLAMLVLLGVSIADSREVSLVLAPNARSAASSLPVLMLAAGLIGSLLARSRIGVVRAHIIGATVAAALLLFTAGESLLQAGVAVSDDALSQHVGAVWMRLEEGVTRYLERELTTPVVVTYLVIGALCWTTAQFSAFSVFRYDRGGPAVIAIGTVLFFNVGLGSFERSEDLLPVLPVLALFSTLAMLLLIRMQLVTQRLQWARRHISDAGEVSRLFLRSGVIFVALTVTGATSLTAVATVEAQDVSLGGLEEPLKDIGDEIARALGLIGVPTPEPPPVTRGDYSRIDETWQPTGGTAFTAAVDGGLRGNYWWGYARDTYELGRGWTSRAVDREPYEEGEPIFVPAESSASGEHRAVTSMTIGDVADASLTAFSLAEPERFINRDVTVISDDRGQGIGVIEFQEPVGPGDGVRAVSYVRDYSPETTDLTANRLRRADGRPPAWIDQYLQVPDGAVGPNVTAFVEQIGRTARPTAYDQAIEIQARLRAMDYETNMSGACDAYAGSVPECVIAEEQGFCQHYATTMAIVLRELDIPSRFVTGYLPGELDRESGVWTVDGSALHNWVEAYFPDIGWVRFDPTPGRRAEGQLPTAFPNRTGPEPSAEPTREPLNPRQTSEPTPEPTPDGDVGPFPPVGPTDPPVTLVIGGGFIIALLLTVASVILLFRLRRLPEGDDGVAYRGIVSLATRLGYGPHPSQTEYEYAGSLSEVIPSVRDELFVVADARVETAYGQRHLDTERRGLLRGAYARIRTALLRLSLRRKH